MSLARSACARLVSDDSGNAIVEFLGLALVLMVPLVYLVLVLGRLEAATFAAEGAAREAARTYVAADTAAEGSARAAAAAGIALRDQGFDDDPVDALTLSCSSTPCLAPGSDVAARIDLVGPAAVRAGVRAARRPAGGAGQRRARGAGRRVPGARG